MAGQIVGPDGEPVDLDALEEEQAGPTLTGVRKIISEHPFQGLKPGRLAALLRQSEEGDPRSYLALAEEMEEKDLHYVSVLGTRKRAVSQLELTVEAASDSAEDERIADTVREALRMDTLEEKLFEILDAIGKGYSVTEIVWDTSESQWMPERLEWRDPRWFEFDRADGRTILLRGEGESMPLTPFKFICHTHKSKAGIPIRGGLARPVAWAALFKNYGIKDWVIFAEVYGQPLRVGKFHSGATAEDKRTLLKAVMGLGTDAAAIIPESMMIEFVTSGARASAELYERLCDWLDRQVSKAVLGQTLTTEVKGGSLAAAQVHDDVRDDIKRSDCKQLAATLNRDYVRPIVDLNHGPQESYPVIHIGLPDAMDAGEKIGHVANLVEKAGLRVSQRWAYEQLGIPVPEDDEELLRPSGATPATELLSSLLQPGVSPETRTALAARLARTLSQQQPAPDSLQQLIAETIEGDGWEPLMEPIVEPIRDALREAESFEEFSERLIALLPSMDASGLAEVLAQAGFAARLAGEFDAPIGDDE